MIRGLQQNSLATETIPFLFVTTIIGVWLIIKICLNRKTNQLAQLKLDTRFLSIQVPIVPCQLHVPPNVTNSLFIFNVMNELGEIRNRFR